MSLIGKLIGLRLTKYKSWQGSAEVGLIYLSALYQNTIYRKILWPL